MAWFLKCIRHRCSSCGLEIHQVSEMLQHREIKREQAEKSIHFLNTAANSGVSRHIISDRAEI